MACALSYACGGQKTSLVSPTEVLSSPLRQGLLWAWCSAVRLDWLGLLACTASPTFYEGSHARQAVY